MQYSRCGSDQCKIKKNSDSILTLYAVVAAYKCIYHFFATVRRSVCDPPRHPLLLRMILPQILHALSLFISCIPFQWQSHIANWSLTGYNTDFSYLSIGLYIWPIDQNIYCWVLLSIKFCQDLSETLILSAKLFALSLSLSSLGNLKNWYSYFLAEIQVINTLYNVRPRTESVVYLLTFPFISLDT